MLNSEVFMLTVVSCSRTYGFCHLPTSRLSNVSVTSIQIQRSFASHLPYKGEKIRTSLANRKVKAQKPRQPEHTSSASSESNAQFQKKILSSLKERGLTLDSDVFRGPVPDGLEDLLGWEKIEEERIKKNMVPEKRKKIEQWAAKGDPLSKLRLENILDYEKRLNCKKSKKLIGCFLKTRSLVRPRGLKAKKSTSTFHENPTKLSEENEFVMNPFFAINPVTGLTERVIFPDKPVVNQLSFEEFKKQRYMTFEQFNEKHKEDYDPETIKKAFKDYDEGAYYRYLYESDKDRMMDPGSIL